MRVMRRKVVVLVLVVMPGLWVVLALVRGVWRDYRRQPRAPGAGAGAGAQPSERAPREPDDRSLEVPQYARQGVPPLDRAWTPEDHVTALEALTTLEDWELPRFDSFHSGPVFTRLTSTDAVRTLLEANLPFEVRADGVETFGQTLAGLGQRYGAAQRTRSVGRTEQLEIVAAMFEIRALHADLFTREGARAPADSDLRARADKLYATLASDLERAARFFARRDYPLVARRTLLTHYPALLAHLPADLRAKTTATLQALANDPAYHDLGAPLQALPGPAPSRPLIPLDNPNGSTSLPPVSRE